MPPERSKCRTSIDGLALPTLTIWECSGKESYRKSKLLILWILYIYFRLLPHVVPTHHCSLRAADEKS